MKRILLFALATLLLFSAVPALAASGSLVQANGAITAVDAAAGQITVKLSNGSDLVFNVDSATVLLSARDGSALKLSDLAAGMSFRAFHSAASTKSLPPQSYLHTLIAATSSDAEYAKDFVVKSATTANGVTDLLNTQGDLILHLRNETDVRVLAQNGHAKASATDIKAGAQLIAWYDVVAMSYPGQANPSKVLILSYGSGDSGNGGSVTPPKTGDAVSDTMAVCAIALSVACLGVWALRTRREK